MESSRIHEEKSHHPRESASKRLFTRLEVRRTYDTHAANAMPPSWPRPSLRIQLMAAASGAAPALIPAAILSVRRRIENHKRDCVLNTLAMELNTTATEAQVV